jgi:hypothetical protein
MRHEIGIAALTHGNPTGYISAGAFAVIIAEFIYEKSLEESLCTIFEI